MSDYFSIPDMLYAQSAASLDQVVMRFTLPAAGSDDVSEMFEARDDMKLDRIYLSMPGAGDTWGGTSLNFDVRKNGASILGGGSDISSLTQAGGEVSREGSLTSQNVSANDEIHVKIAASGTTTEPEQGIVVTLIFENQDF